MWFVVSIITSLEKMISPTKCHLSYSLDSFRSRQWPTSFRHTNIALPWLQSSQGSSETRISLKRLFLLNLIVCIVKHSGVPLSALDSTQIKNLIWLSRTLVNVMGEYFAIAKLSMWRRIHWGNRNTLKFFLQWIGCNLSQRGGATLATSPGPSQILSQFFSTAAR